MSKDARVSFSCSECGHFSSKWFGLCPQCNAWDTASESSTFAQSKKSPISSMRQAATMCTLDAVEMHQTERMCAGIDEWDRVVGGGIVPGSLLMVTGDPGIGKSTLLLHLAHKLSVSYRVFYFSSEESLEQVKSRAERIGCTQSSLLFSDQAHLDEIIAAVEQQKPDLVIIDSIQNCYGNGGDWVPGGVSQLRESVFRLMRLAKEKRVAILLSGHITKEGVLAGPKMLEHMVDAVFYLQGEDRWQTRVLRSVKNRFGTVHELGFFEMGSAGLSELANINEHLLSNFSMCPGSVLVGCLEGSRPLLLELQTLMVPTQYGMAQRVISGVDAKQVVIVAAILEKYLHIKFSAHDIFFKISGGVKIRGTPPDLGIALSLLSSFFQQSLPPKSLVLGEVSLTGQIQPINAIGIHVGEAEKFGIQDLYVAHNQKIERAQGMRIHRIKQVGELLALFE